MTPVNMFPLMATSTDLPRPMYIEFSLIPD
jgi:hypothetical protein